jgi:DNA/RNA-binding domain of Phe-tRNA-synthetase-like protein
MQLSIDSSVLSRTPNLGLGVIHYTGCSVTPSPKQLQGRINLYVESLRLEHELARLSEIAGVRAWRADFKQLGIDPARYRPSSEALLRRLLQGNPFHWINTAVDVNNFLSIRHALPYGIYNRALLEGPIVCRLGEEADSYQALNGRVVEMKGKILLADANGPFGSPIVDSVRTCVTEETADLLQVIFFHQQLPPAERDAILRQTARLFTEINGGEAVSAELVAAA